MHTGFNADEFWQVEWITSPRFFMKALRPLMPSGSVVYLESYDDCDSGSEFRSYVAEHRCSTKFKEPVREACSNPKPTWTEHLAFGDSLITSVEKFFTRWNFPYAHHVHGYHRGNLIFWFHDAFQGGDLHIAPRFAESEIAQFCQELAPKFQRRSISPRSAEGVPNTSH